MVQDPITLAVMQKQNAIIAAEVGAATGTKARELTANTEHWCSVAKDRVFWEGLELIVGDLELICYAINIGQKDSPWADTILLSLVEIFLHFDEHPIKEVVKAALGRLKQAFESLRRLQRCMILPAYKA